MPEYAYFFNRSFCFFASFNVTAVQANEAGTAAWLNTSNLGQQRCRRKVHSERQGENKVYDCERPDKLHV